MRLTADGWASAGDLAGPPLEPTWLDYELANAPEADTILATEWLREVFPQLEASRAATGGKLPPSDPPRIRTFAEWAFARVYWLGSTTVDGDPTLLTQEVHVLASSSLVVTLRYPVTPWTLLDGEGADLPDGHPKGLDIAKIRRHVVEIGEMCDTPEPHFGALVMTAIFGRITSSYIQALELLGRAADELEARVSGLDRVDVSRETLRLRRALRQVRWAFLPDDESGELLTWPTASNRDSALDARLIDVGAESNRALATTREVMEQAQQTFDLQIALREEAIERATFSLTVVAALVLPPTLIASIYSMNFLARPWADGKPALVMMGASMLVSWLSLRRLDPRRGKR